MRNIKTLAILYVIVISFFLNCNNSVTNSEISLQPNDSLLFRIGFEYSINGSYIGSDGKQYFYFSDPTTFKKIKIFDVNANLYKEISLNEYYKNNNEVQRIDILNEDTIIILGKNDNKISIINSLGNVWKYYNLKEQTIDVDSNYYDLYGCRNINYMRRGNKIVLYYSTDFSHCLSDTSRNFISADSEEYQINYYRKLYNTSPFCRIDILFNDSLIIQFGFNDFYKQVSPSPFVPFFAFSYFVVDKEIFIFSADMPNKLIRIDSNLNITKEIDIKSSHTSIGILPLLIKEDSLSEKIEERTTQAVGWITNVFKINNSNNYIVIVAHKSNNSSIERDFSILLFDAEFVLQKEYLFSGKEYNLYRLFLNSFGNLMIEKRKNNANEKLFYSFTIH